MLHKPFKSLDDQVALLASRGLEVDNRTRSILQREGYYSIVNGYKEPFIDDIASRNQKDDRYLPGTTFNDLYDLFVFDRNLRLLCFQVITLAEATLRSICAHSFSETFPDEPNAYLNPANYAQSGDRRLKAQRLIPTLEKIIHSHTEAKRGGKAYLVHCKRNHDGEIPLWVLTNVLSMGQMFWFHQSLDKRVRGKIARTFTEMYAQSHRHPKSIRAARLDSAYKRIKEFRNICAHDERFYSARPQNKNASVFQLIQDLQLVIEKQKYLEFLQQVNSLLTRLERTIPNHIEKVYEGMGLAGLQELEAHMERVRDS